jgi:predicted nuclease with TOPRIM domain
LPTQMNYRTQIAELTEENRLLVEEVQTYRNDIDDIRAEARATIEKELALFADQIRAKTEELARARETITELEEELERLHDETASVISGETEGGTLRQGYEETEHRVQIRGEFFRIIKGPRGRLYTRRTHGQLVPLSPRQNRDKIPV